MNEKTRQQEGMQDKTRLKSKNKRTPPPPKTK